MELIAFKKSRLNALIGAVDHASTRKNANINGQYKKNCILYTLGPNAKRIYIYIKSDKNKCTNNLDSVVYVIIVDTGNETFVTNWRLSRMHFAPCRIQSLIKNHGTKPTSINGNLSNETTPPLSSTLTKPALRSPTENANQYTKSVNSGLTTAHAGPIAAPL